MKQTHFFEKKTLLLSSVVERLTESKRKRHPAESSYSGLCRDSCRGINNIIKIREAKKKKIARKTPFMIMTKMKREKVEGIMVFGNSVAAFGKSNFEVSQNML